MKRFWGIIMIAVGIIYKVLRAMAWGISILVTALLIVWVVYYFIKADFPPQEVWIVISEFLPWMSSVLERIVPSSVFDFIEIDPTVVEQESLMTSEEIITQ